MRRVRFGPVDMAVYGAAEGTLWERSVLVCLLERYRHATWLAENDQRQLNDCDIGTFEFRPEDFDIHFT